MIQSQLDQFMQLAKKATLSPEEQKVMDSLVAVSLAETAAAATVQPVPAALAEANDQAEDAAEALVAKPSTTS